MGKTWSKVKPGYVEAGDNPSAPETENGPLQKPSIPPSEPSTGASSSVSVYHGGPFCVAGADVEVTPCSRYHNVNHGCSAGPHSTLSLKKSQGSPSSAGTQKRLRRKAKARVASPPAKRVGTREESSTPSPSQFSPDEDTLALTEVEQEEEEKSVSLLPEEDLEAQSAMEGEDSVPLLHTSAQKLLLFELDRKRKAPAGLPSLVVEPSRVKLEKSSDGRRRTTATDLGAGIEAVGRRVKKATGSRSVSEGHVASYDVASRLYQIHYDNGKEETMQRLDLEPCLVDQRKMTSAPVEETKTLRKSLRNAARAKKVEVLYTNRKVRGRRRKK